MGVGIARSEGELDRYHVELLLVYGRRHRRSRGLTLAVQIPPFYQLLDRCDQVLDRQRGLMGVVDFYTSRELGHKERVRVLICQSRCDIKSWQAIGTASKRVSWFAKWFWECWFEMDNVHLHGSRRGMLD